MLLVVLINLNVLLLIVGFLLWPFDGWSTYGKDHYINELFKLFDIVVFYFILFKFKITIRYLGFVIR